MQLSLTPQTQKKLARFKQIKVGYFSFLALAALSLLLCLAELWVNSRALVVKYEDNLYFPTYGAIIPGSTFGLGYEYETNYRDLQQRLADSDENWVVLPPVPYNPFENDAQGGILRPTPPDIDRGHYLGTDTTGRDILARLVYGTRTALLFALAFMVSVYVIGIVIGCSMGYFGGAFDLIFQRFIEIWTSVPSLYLLIIIAAVIEPGFFILLGILLLFSWVSLVGVVRAEFFRARNFEYVEAARALGVGTLTIMFRHLLPNAMVATLTFMPFILNASITTLTSLDFLGFGLPPGSPSLGELLAQGKANLQAPWLGLSGFFTIAIMLSLLIFIGEAVRDAFDPRKTLA